MNAGSFAVAQVVVTSTRNVWIEAMFLLVLVGLALYAVCRASGRR